MRRRILLICSAGMTEEEARAKYLEVHEQYQNAGHEMQSLTNLREVSIFETSNVDNRSYGIPSVFGQRNITGLENSFPSRRGKFLPISYLSVATVAN